MGLSGSLQRNMAKFVCLFALVGVAAGAPSPAAVRVVNANNQRDVVNTIMTTLEPSIDAAIAKALREYSFSLISSPVQFAGAASQGSFGAAGQSSQSSFSSSSSSSGSSAIQQAVSQGAAHQKGVHFQTAGAGGVVYHDGSSQQLSGSSGSQQQSTSTIVQNNAKLTSVSASQQQQVVEKVMIALAPSIEAAVQAALLNLRQQQSSVSSRSFSAGSQQSSGFSVSATQQVSAAEEQALVLRIIEVLTPTITTSVRRALASRVQCADCPG